MDIIDRIVGAEAIRMLVEMRGNLSPWQDNAWWCYVRVNGERIGAGGIDATPALAIQACYLEWQQYNAKQAAEQAAHMPTLQYFGMATQSDIIAETMRQNG